MADKSIGQLNVFPAGAEISTTNTLFAVQYSNAAYQLNGQRFVNALAALLDGHGGIASISYTAPVAPSLVGTMTITYADATTTTVSVNNGKGISSITKTGTGGGTSGLEDTYTITYNDATTSTFKVTNGAKGDTGTPAYVHIKYSATYPVTTMSDLPDEWMGIYTNSSATASSIPSDYAWYQIKGTKGDTGNQGVSITSVTLTSGSHQPGTLDTYTITYSDSSTSAFQVYNGMDGTGAGTVTSVGVANATGGGLTVSGSPITSSGTINIGHSNSVTAQNTQGIYPIKIDANGHISAYGAKPTTLAGFGITDANISNGVITLGNNTITPVTDVSGKADKNGVDNLYIKKTSLEEAQVVTENATNTSDEHHAKSGLRVSTQGNAGLFDYKRSTWIIGHNNDGELMLNLDGTHYTVVVDSTATQGTAGYITIVPE